MQGEGGSLDNDLRAQGFERFWIRILAEVLLHPVIVDNRYTQWFARGEMSLAQLRAFIVQFSVFSNLFLVAQLKKMLNADSSENMRLSREILANEIGVAIQSGAAGAPTVEGGRFSHRLAHFEWLRLLAADLGLSFGEIGKRRHGSKATLRFCDALEESYGNEEYAIAQASSFAVENWANAGFWKELIAGLRVYNQIHGTRFADNFFVFHDKLEEYHARHTQDELREIYFSGRINEDEFIRVANHMLDAIKVFWDGLERERREIEKKARASKHA